MNKSRNRSVVLCCLQVHLLKNLAELSAFDELVASLKQIAAHVLSADNMRLVTRCSTALYNTNSTQKGHT